MKKIYLIVLIISFCFVGELYSQEEQWFSKGEKALQQKDYDEAIKNFNKVIEKNSKKPEPYYFRGFAYLYQENVQSALEDFSKVIQIDSTNSDAYNNRGLCYGYLGQLDLSVNDFKKAIEIDSNFDKAYLNLGSAYFAMQKYDESIEILNKVVKMDSNNAENYFLRGSVFLLLDSIEYAILDFTSAIDHGLTIGKAYFNRANAYYKSEKYIETIKDLNKVIEMDSNDVEALNNRAIAFSKLGLTEQANKDRDIISGLLIDKAGLPDLKTVKYEQYKFLGNKITFELPKDWAWVKDTTGYGEMMIVSADSIAIISDTYNAGVRIAFDSNMYYQYQVKTVEELLNFWEMNSNLSIKAYKEYNEISKMPFKKEGYEGFIRESILRVDDNTYAIGLYEVVLVKEDKLFYAFLQSPKIHWAYFRKVFDRAIESLRLGV